MKLIGNVEVYSIRDGEPHLELKENNLVVDGAGELICNMLTVPYSVTGQAQGFAADASNYTIQALSMGKAAKLYGADPETSAADSSVIGMHAVYNASSLSDVYNASDSQEFIIGFSNTSSMSSSTYLPKDPHSRDQWLEQNTKTQIELYLEQSALGEEGLKTPGLLSEFVEAYNPTSSNYLEVSAGTPLPQEGHNLNAFYSRSAQNMVRMHQGCYMPSDGMEVRIINQANISRSVLDGVGATSTTLIDQQIGQTENIVSGHFNHLGVVDERGYIRVQPYGELSDNTEGVVVSAARVDSDAALTYSGKVLNSATSGDWVASPAIEVAYTVSSPDVLGLHMYKGVTNIGLWYMDLCNTFANEDPPIAWTAPTNNRKYKLFAKKSFTTDITRIQDNGTAAGIENFDDLLIRWRISFDHGGTF